MSVLTKAFFVDTDADDIFAAFDCERSSVTPEVAGVYAAFSVGITCSFDNASSLDFSPTGELVGVNSEFSSAVDVVGLDACFSVDLAGGEDGFSTLVELAEGVTGFSPTVGVGGGGTDFCVDSADADPGFTPSVILVDEVSTFSLTVDSAA